MNERNMPVNGHMLVGGCADRADWNTQLLYFTCSSLSRDDRWIFLLSDRTGNPNMIARDLFTGEERILTDNRNGTLKSYVYFDGTPGRGLGKASACLDCENRVVYYIQDDAICSHSGDRIFFNSRGGHTVNVYAVSAQPPQR